MAMVENLEMPVEEEVPFNKYKELYKDLEFCDDISGAMLDKEDLIKAKHLEMEYFKEMCVYTKVRREKGTKIITTKWIDTNKGDDLHRNYRSRLVGRELNLSKRDDLFAGTPPLEALRFVISQCASNQGHHDKRRDFVLMSSDVSRAYF